MAAWAVGQRLQAGKYTIDAVLGVGGFGITYLAEDAAGNFVVIKTLNDTAQRDPRFEQFQQDFVNEALWLAKCAHPHIVQVHRVFQESGLWCMVMEYIAGENLAVWVRKRGTLAEAEALNYIQQVGDALKLMHQNGLLHRDVKPENIMLRAGRAEAVLLDLGIAREFTPNLTQTHTAILSNGYAPIEQYEYQARRGAYSDVYGLAATLYFILTGKIPEDAQVRAYNTLRYSNDPLEPPKALNPHISDRTNHAILKGMAVEANDRPQSIQDWLELLPDSDSVPAIALEPDAPEQAIAEAAQPAAAATPRPIPLSTHEATLPLLPQPALASEPRPCPAPPAVILPPNKTRRVWVIGGVLATSLLTSFGVGYWLVHQRARADLAKLEQLQAEGNYEECIARAERVPDIHPTYNAAQELRSQCINGMFDRAQQFASNAQFQEAIQAVAKIPPDSPLRQEAEDLTAQWADGLLQQATQRYEQDGKLDEAIALAQAIPSNTPAGQQVQDTIAQWQEEWSANESTLQAARQSLEEGKWYDARDKANSLTTPYWQAQAAEIIQEADAQIAAIEAEEQRRQAAEAAAAEQQAQETAFAAALDRCRESGGRNWQEACQEFEELCEAQGGTFVADATHVGCTPAIEHNKEPKEEADSEAGSDSPRRQPRNSQRNSQQDDSSAPELIVPIPGEQ